MENSPKIPNTVTVTESGKGRFIQEISAGTHILIADEPRENGGNDAGPSPYDYLLAALGSCTSMTIRLYSEQKHLPLKKIIVTLTHEKIYAQDCIDCEKETSMIDVIQRRIELQGDLSKEQREKLLEIANKCPVHRTLTSKIKITTELK